MRLDTSKAGRIQMKALGIDLNANSTHAECEAAVAINPKLKDYMTNDKPKVDGKASK